MRLLVVIPSKERSPSQSEQLQEHLAECPDCASVERSYEALRRRIYDAVEQEPVPDLSTQWFQISHALQRKTEQHTILRIIAKLKRQASLLFSVVMLIVGTIIRAFPMKEFSASPDPEEAFPKSFEGLPRFPRLSFLAGENLFRKRFGKLLPVAMAVWMVLGFFLFYIVQADMALSSGIALFAYPQQSGPVSAVAWSPDGQYIATGGWDHTVQIWKAKRRVTTPITTYKYHSELVDALAWSPDGKKIASGSWDHTVQVWDAFTGHPLFTYRGHSAEVSTLAWSPDGKEIASGSWDHTVQVWNASTGQPILTHKGKEFVNTLAWSPDSQEIAFGGSDSKVQIWNVSTGAIRLAYWYALGNPVDALAWSPDGQEIAFGGRGTTVQIVDASTGGLLFTYKEHDKEVDALAWSPDGKYIASGSYDRTAQVWDAQTGRKVYTYTGHSDIVDALAWSPDSKKIVSGSWDSTVAQVQVWLAKGEQ
jgi:WD40 repeat protein